MFAGTHHPDKIERNESTGNTQQHASRDALYRPHTVEMERKQGRIATEDIDETRSRHTRHQDGQ